MMLLIFAPGDIYFDVGAHKGDKADYFLQKGYECVLVEPQQNLVEHLRQKYQDQPWHISFLSDLVKK